MQKLRNNKSVPRLGCNSNHQSSGWRGGGLRQRLTLVKLANYVGSASAVALGLLALVLLSPNIDQAADALTVNDYTDSAGTTIKVAADPVMSIGLDTNVDFAFTPKTAGEFQSQIAKLTIATNNTDGYKILMTTSTGTLSSGNGNVIRSIVGNNIAPENFAMNSWGYKLDDMTGYSAMPTTATEIKYVDTGEVTVSSTKTYNLAFGTKINSDLPAGTYSGEVIISAIANPIKITNLMQLTYMQDMKPEYCANTLGTDGQPVSATLHNEPSIQLTDTRDGKKYWVSKLADGNCWMTQNLDLDIPAAGLKAADTDITRDWNSSSQYPPVETTKTTQFNVSTAMTNTHSWSLGDYVLKDPTSNLSCAEVTSGGNLNSCNRLEIYDGTQDRHYAVGNYYQWNAVTAGTGGTIDNQNAEGSICPKGWTLPTTNLDGLISNLTSQYPQTNVMLSPLYFTRSGYVDSGSNSVHNIGYGGYYWTKTAGADSNNANYVMLTNNGVQSNSLFRWLGFTARCVSR